MIFLTASLSLDPHPLALVPFALLLACIAALPLLAARFWEHAYRQIAVILGAMVVGYYAIGLHGGARLLEVAGEYAGFMIFIGSLFVVSGGIHLAVKGESTPGLNVLTLLLGAVLANLLGTTGASMLLIRPWIRANRYRYSEFHTCFFIFVVSNIGGCLTPIGDPPLYLGYLKGIPFFWITGHTFLPWLVALGLLLGIFYVLDRRNFLRAPAVVRDVQTAHESWRFEGLGNLGAAGVIVASLILAGPGWREALMAGAAIGSYLLTPKAIHAANRFTFGPIMEIAWLFLGIFSTMIPALDYLETHAASLGITTPLHFYWLCGALSGVLDNAPTYLAFLAAAFGLKNLALEQPGHMAAFLASHAPFVTAVSLGSVFFGAMTYIGNVPNFMVKSICDHAGVRTPSFLGYLVKFSVPVLLPIFALIAWVFVR